MENYVIVLIKYGEFKQNDLNLNAYFYTEKNQQINK